MTWQAVSNSPAETDGLGCLLGGLLRPGDVIFLTGGLGSGKTAFARGLARGLGAEGARSPSFTLVNRYQGRIPVYHADLYRLTDAAQAEPLDLAEISADGVLIVEWPDLIASDFPSRLEVEFKLDDEREAVRFLELSGRGARYQELARELKKLVDSGF